MKKCEVGEGDGDGDGDGDTVHGDGVRMGMESRHGRPHIGANWVS